jgi:transcriptional regulator with XRE-family HTH domain
MLTLTRKSWMSKQLKEQIGERLRAVRERAHISIQESAKAAGVQPLAVEKWERGSSLPPLLEFRALLPLYGVMACELLFDSNPLTFSQEEAVELRQAAKALSPALRARVDCLLAVMAQGTEPAWKNVA